jgi:hypothetical protein
MKYTTEQLVKHIQVLEIEYKKLDRENTRSNFQRMMTITHKLAKLRLML